MQLNASRKECTAGKWRVPWHAVYLGLTNLRWGGVGSTLEDTLYEGIEKRRPDASWTRRRTQRIGAPRKRAAASPLCRPLRGRRQVTQRVPRLVHLAPTNPHGNACNGILVIWKPYFIFEAQAFRDISDSVSLE